VKGRETETTRKGERRLPTTSPSYQHERSRETATEEKEGTDRTTGKAGVSRVREEGSGGREYRKEDEGVGVTMRTDEGRRNDGESLRRVDKKVVTAEKEERRRKKRNTMTEGKRRAQSSE
jgi:hypothetical protein